METLVEENNTSIKESFEPELKFTETYKRFKDADKAIRELECLKVQLPSMLVPIKEGDLIAGRLQYNTIGFHHIVYGFGSSDGNDRAGYCYDKGLIDKKLERIQADEESRKKVEEMCAFWETENTNFKARAAFTDDMKKAGPTDDWMTHSAIVHPLYRIAELQPDHLKLVSLGLPGLRKEIRRGILRAEKYGGDITLYKAMDGALDLVVYAINYYIKDIEQQLKTITCPDRKEELRQILDSLKNIKDNKPKSFREALQLMWIFNITAGIADFNRMDVVLGDFYAADLDKGAITEQEAIRILRSVWRLIDEIFRRNSRVILGGYGRLNEENADRFAMAALEATRLHKGGLYPQTSLRYYEGMDCKLMDKALDVLGEGCTFPVLYNDDVNVPGVEKAFGVSREVAQDYSFLGCGEFMLGHRSIGTPNVIINLAKVLEVTLRNGRDAFTGEVIGLELGEFKEFNTFEELFEAYNKQTKFFIEQSAKMQEQIYVTLNENATFLLQSMLLSDCLAKGRGMLDGGIQHLGGTIETYGNITTADSLTAIKEMVYDKKAFSQEELLKILDADFEGYQKERQMILNVSKYGNDEEQADSMAVRVHEHICNLVREQKNKTIMDSFLVVEINNSANTILGRYVAATPDGRFSRSTLSNGNGPVQGMDKKGITALINSLTKMRCDIHAGIAQNLKFSKTLFNEHREQLKNIIHTYFELGGSQANVNVVNKKDLEQAMIEPEKYQNLIVRVGGISVRFVELDRAVQEDMIRRTTY